MRNIIFCLVCLGWSPHPDDIKHGWCARCNDYTESTVQAFPDDLISATDPRLLAELEALREKVRQ
jgi:hypothetical protein